MKIGSLFTGYGGLDMAVADALGGETVWVSDIDKGARKILAHRYPDAPNLGDITKIKWTPDCPTCGDALALYWTDQLPEGRGYYCPHDGWFSLDIWTPESGAANPVDVLTGGFPCQDVSHAGKRAGIRPGTRSGLWEHFAYAIDQLKPSLVVIENVRGLLSASAHSDLEPCPWCLGDGSGGHLRALGAVLGGLADIGYDAEWVSLRAADVGSCHGRFRVFIVAHPRGSLADARRLRGDAGRLATPGQAEGGGPLAISGERGGVDSLGGHERRGGARGDELLLKGIAKAQEWGDYEPAIRRWEAATRPAPAPTETGPKGSPRLSPRFTEWMMGLPAGWITDVPGITRNEALKACGNGVVPQQAVEALRWLLTVEAVA